jgi:hypothetical protein
MKKKETGFLTEEEAQARHFLSGEVMAIDRRLHERVILVRGDGKMGPESRPPPGCLSFPGLHDRGTSPTRHPEIGGPFGGCLRREKEVEGITAKLVNLPSQISEAWREGKIPIFRSFFFSR